MIEYSELRTISMDFRRISSNFLCSTDSTVSTQIQRFKIYIDNTPYIAEIIQEKIKNITFNYEDCFIKEAHGGWSEINPPVDESCHIKAMYDYLDVIIKNNSNVLGPAMSYFHRAKNFNEIIQDFLRNAFNPLIDFIRDSISKEMMKLDQTNHINPITQNIENNYGTVNAAGKDVNSSNLTTINNGLSNEILELVDKLYPIIDGLNIKYEEKEDITDDLETIRDEIIQKEPKKTKLRKALASIKGFIEKVGVSLAVKGITSVDWQDLINKLTHFIENIKP